MPDILDLIKSRRSVRSYKNRPVEKDKIKRVIEAARWAPSSMNSQPWKFYVMDTKGKEELIQEIAFGREFVSTAPNIIIACGDEAKTKDCMADVAFAIENMIIEAHSLGLGSCIVGYFDKEIAKSVFKIDEKLTVFYIITLGYPNEETIKKDRKPLEEIYEYMED